MNNGKDNIQDAEQIAAADRLQLLNFTSTTTFSPGGRARRYAEIVRRPDSRIESKRKRSIKRIMPSRDSPYNSKNDRDLEEPFQDDFKPYQT